MKDINDVLRLFDGVMPSGTDEWKALCPAHDDHNQSLSIGKDRNTGRIMMKCHAGCTFNEIINEVGLTVSDLTPPKTKTETPKRFDYNNVVATYVYQNGTRKLRDCNKCFTWQHLEGDQWKNGRGNAKHCLYKVNELTETVYIVEGEKDVDNLSKFGVSVVSGEHGADKNGKWLTEYTEELKNVHTAIILQDNDDVGKAFALHVANELVNKIPVVKILDLTKIYEDLPVKGDISDVINVFHDATLNALKTLEEQTEKYHTITVQADLSDVKPNDFSDLGNAEKIYSIYQGKAYYCSAIGWLVWNGEKWCEDAGEASITKLVIDYADAMLKDAKEKEMAYGGEGVGKSRYMKHAEYTRKTSNICNAVKLCKSLMNIQSDKLDADPYLLNTKGGVIDLRTGDIKPHDPKLLCTKIAPYNISDDNRSMWEDFLDLVTCGDQDFKEYLQYYIGMCSIGVVNEEMLGIAVGGGRNGKSTLFNACSTVLGDYSFTIDSAILTTEQQNKKATLAMLRGKRFVTCGELEENKRLSVALAKKISSTDKIAVERKFKDPDEMTPSHHVTLFTNFLPKVTSNDNGTWSRLKIFPFNAVMPKGNQQIKNYAQVLARNCGGVILDWIVEGAIKFFQNGERLPEQPQVVTACTDEYKEREDWLNQFIADQCIVDENANVGAGELYKAYYAYAKETEMWARQRSTFVNAMQTKGFKQYKDRKNLTYWKGIKLDDGQFAISTNGTVSFVMTEEKTPFNEE